MGIKVGIASNPIPPVEISIASGVQAEADGYDSIWFPDHLMGWFPRSVWTPENSSIASVLPSPHIYLDTTIVMALVGRETEKIQIGSGVTDPIRRPPAELARTFLTLSHATQGRAILGIGAGERENVEPYGMDYSKQVSRLEEALHIIRLLWESKDSVDFDGRFWKLRRAVLDLEPFGGEFPPIWVGAHGPRMLEITGRYADGWYPSYPMTPSEYQSKLEVIRKAAADAGRDPSAIVAGYQMYAIVTPDHDLAHQLMSMPLAKAMSLVAPASQWKKAGKAHPFGENFEGLRDYVPEWYSAEDIENALSHFDVDVIHDMVPHGTVEEVTTLLEPFIHAGLEHLTFANIGVLAGIEHLESTRAGLLEVAKALR